jgi:hypothetical protein
LGGGKEEKREKEREKKGRERKKERKGGVFYNFNILYMKYGGIITNKITNKLQIKLEKITNKYGGIINYYLNYYYYVGKNGEKTRKRQGKDKEKKRPLSATQSVGVCVVVDMVVDI